MSVYGDGSNGALNVTSGSYSLALDTKYQFTTVNVASGATLTSGSTTGSVLYILATTSIVINGTINVSNITNYGNNTWSVTIDGDTYSSPGVAAGGNGGYTTTTAYRGLAANGFGGGGSGGYNAYGGANPGKGGSGGLTPSGGAPYSATLTSNGTATGSNDGFNSAGGGGSTYLSLTKDAGVTATLNGTSGQGGQTHGANGTNASGNLTVGGSGSYSYVWATGGGGGAGGRAGRPGVHVVLKAPSITLNGTVITSGTAGTNGGVGGAFSNWANDGAFSTNGASGGGGGGGNAGNVYVVYSDTFSDSSTKTLSGGAAGSGGAGSSSYAGSNGTAGTAGTLTIKSRVVQIARTTNADSTFSLVREFGTLSLTRTASTDSVFSTLAKFQPLVQKDYEARIYTHDGVYLSTLRNITSEFAYQQSINQNAGALNISVARSPDNKATNLAILQDDLGATITDTNGDIIYVPTETPNSVGPGTDIDLNHNVDVYTFYGGYEQLLDTDGDPITDTTGDPILTSYGAPNGLRVFSGYIADYELKYGTDTGVNIVVVPHATELSHYVFMDSLGNTSVSYLNTDPVKMARDAMDDYISQGGVVTYDTDSMPLSGESSDYTFNLQTTRESLDKSIELLPSGYYHYPHPGENKVYLLPKGTTANHTFYYQYHISELNLKKSITQLKNKVYFVGGDTGAGDSLFTFTEDTASQTSYRAGLERLADSRVKLVDSATALSYRELNTYKDPRYRTTVTIFDKVYDIETIRLGQMVAFKNFGTFLDNLILQIVSINRAKHSVTFDLDMIVPNDTKRLIELKKELNSQIVAAIPDVPTEI